MTGVLIRGRDERNEEAVEGGRLRAKERGHRTRQPALLASQASVLQNCVKMNFCRLCRSSLWSFVLAAPAN